jgi:asparagine synthase (glutamine-hydrolysing)
MCGIVGVIDRRSSVSPDAVRVAAATLYSRGPDDSGTWVSENVGFGQQRLAILDRSPSGHQPMLSSDKRFVIVFNGEIYNFRELREQVDKNEADWQSQGDTEVILAAYAKWGTRCVEHFRGMFAFALWDRQQKVLYAARDRMGVKPFYYHDSADSFVFASRPRAILSLKPNLSGAVDEQALRLYLESGYVPAPYSIFRSIRKLPPAHWLIVENGHLQIERYWDYRQISIDLSWEQRREEDLLDELDEILTRSVRSRMTSDVPLGAFLSGGIDSSLVVAMMAKQSSKPIKTFTIGFEEKGFDESDHALAVSRWIGTEHHCERLKLDTLLELMPRFVREYDEPFFDSSAFPTMAVSRFARRHVTVTLSGDGGDELFGGYHYYRIVHQMSPLFALPSWVRKAVAATIGGCSQHRAQLLAAALRRTDVMDAFCFVRSIAKDFEGLLSPEVLRRTMSMRDLFEEVSNTFPPGLTAAEKCMRFDAYYTLPDDYLQKVDVASMAFSLEAREPMLDQDLVAWAMRLPLKWKLRGHQNKYLLRKLAYRYFPRTLIDRPKKGFEVPIAAWLREALRDWAIERINDEGTFDEISLNRVQMRRLFAIHESGTRNVHPLLWAILMLVEFVRNVPGINANMTTPLLQHET